MARAEKGLEIVSGVVINPGRCRHSRQTNKILTRMLVPLHVPGRGGEQLFGGFTVFREAGDAGADRHVHGFAGSD